MHARVRYAQSLTIDGLLIVKQEVEVEGAWRVVILAAASKKTFDGEQGVEQLRRRQASVQGGDGVDEIGLAADRAVSHRRAAVKRGQAQQSAFGYVGQRATGQWVAAVMIVSLLAPSM